MAFGQEYHFALPRSSNTAVMLTTGDAEGAGWMTGARGWWGGEMTDRNSVLKWAHLSRGRIRDPRILTIIEDQRRFHDAHVAEIWAEQEEENTALAARPVNPTRLTLAPRYLQGIAHLRNEAK